MKTLDDAPQPIPMLLVCPCCGCRHVDEGEFRTKPHHTHACQHCGMCWRPAIVPTVGVKFLPGFRDDDEIERMKTRLQEATDAMLAAAGVKHDRGAQ